MKIVFLNAWHGERRASLSDFIRENIPSTDVFCFQEAGGALPAMGRELLTGYTEIAAHKLEDAPHPFYQATYVRQDIPIAASHSLFEREEDLGFGIYVRLTVGGAPLHIINFHGTSRPVDKSDTPARMRQAQELMKFFKDKVGKKIIGGDFNIFPTNKSQQLFGEKGYRDLVKEFGITNTRNHFVWDRYPQNPRQYYSDYVFISPDVPIESFDVPEVEVSDHLPLLLTISVE